MRGATRSNDLARRCDEMTTAFRFANVSMSTRPFGKGGQSKCHTSSGLKLPHRAHSLCSMGAPRRPTLRAVGGGIGTGWHS
jgi:hypothetical protein